MGTFFNFLIFLGALAIEPFRAIGTRRMLAEIERDKERERQEAVSKIRSQYGNIQGPNGTNAELYAATKTLFDDAAFPDPMKFSHRLVLAFLERCDALGLPNPHYDIALPMIRVAASLYAAERLNDLPPDPSPYGSGTAVGELRDLLVCQQRKAIDPKTTLLVLGEVITQSFLVIARNLPPLARGNPEGDTRADATISIPFIELLPNVPKLIEDTLEPYFSDPRAEQIGLFSWLHDKLQANRDRIVQKSGTKRIPSPTTYPGSPTEIVAAFLGDTPLESIFLEGRVPFQIREEDRGEHTAIIAGSGWGKTQLLQSIIAEDLLIEDPPAMVVIDSTGAMVQRIQHLAVFNDRLKDRLVIIDPELDPVPALNMFDVSSSRLAGYDKSFRESIESDVISLFNYVFSSTENPLTAQQMTPFTFMVRLMLAIPGANLNTMVELLEDNPRDGYESAKPKFKTAIERLDHTAQNFFKTQFYARGTSEARRDQIAQRIYGVIKVPAFERMFSTVNKVDMFAELNRGSIILINTSENLLKEGSTTFGRYMIARTMAAAFERASIPAENRRQAFLIVDEAAPYFDEQFEKLLNRVRQFKLGAVIAFQNLEQASEKLRSTIGSSTAVKYAGGTAYTDARWLSREMRVDPEFIVAQRRDAARPPQWTQFACYVRNFTDHAVSLTVPFYMLENMSKMTEAEHAALLERNRARVSADPFIAMPEANRPSPLPDETMPTAALITAYADLAAAMSESDWERAAELRNNVIPALEQQDRTFQPRPAAPRPDQPRPAAAHRDSSSDTEGAADWH